MRACYQVQASIFAMFGLPLSICPRSILTLERTGFPETIKKNLPFTILWRGSCLLVLLGPVEFHFVVHFTPCFADGKKAHLADRFHAKGHFDFIGLQLREFFLQR